MHWKLEGRTVALLFALLPLTAIAAGAQPTPRPPDAGQVLEETARPLAPPPPPAPLPDVAAPAGDSVSAGGPRVIVQAVELEGMSVFSADTLRAALGEVDGRYDMAGLQELAGRLTRYYRQHGYPFATAYLPPQSLSDGTLRIAIVEGRYGQVRVGGDEALRRGGERFLAPLRPGSVIEGAALYRSLLLLGEQPGIESAPVLMPGTEIGTGDLDVTLRQGPRIDGELAIDNHGNRYTGAWRGEARLNVNRLLLFGDRLELAALLSEEGLWFGRAGYALPLGGRGLRARLSYVHTYYELGEEYADLDATGTADVGELSLSYPLLRSARSNFALQVGYRYKDLEDEDGTGAPDRQKKSHALPLLLPFDRRDPLGLTWGQLGWTPGRLILDDSLKVVDRLSARSGGEFHKFNLELARLQRLPAPFSLFGRFAGQWTGDNLDSSEGFLLGGADGVRAWPEGEAFGDKGWLAQVELRCALGPFTPYGFYDSGAITVNADPWDGGDNHRSLTGGGAGLRFAAAGLSLDAAAAWRLWGGAPESDKKGDHPRYWLSARYRF